MLMRVRAAAIGAACMLLAGCASHPVVPFDKSVAGNIKTIDVVTPYMPEQPTVVLASSVGQSFGLVGALVDASMQSSRDSDFWKEIDGKDHPPRTTFNDALTAALQAEGYTVQPIAVNRKHAAFLKTYPKDPGADAFLDVTFEGDGYGYIAAGISKSTPYRPYVYVDCKLVRASDKAVLMEDQILYNPILPAASQNNGITISPNPDYEFPTFDDMKADPPHATQGLNDALKQTANAVANLVH